MDRTTGVYDAACHCGAVGLRITLDAGFGQVRRCTCSFCRMRGAVVVPVPRLRFALLRGDAALSVYRFHTGKAKHHFCKVCGIYTHHFRRSDPDVIGVNVACIAGISPFDFAEVPVMDGVAHPSDTGVPQRLAGVLRFDATAR